VTCRHFSILLITKELWEQSKFSGFYFGHSVLDFAKAPFYLERHAGDIEAENVQRFEKQKKRI